MPRSIYAISVPPSRGVCVLCPEPTFAVFGLLQSSVVVTPSLRGSLRGLVWLGSTENINSSFVATKLFRIDPRVDPDTASIVPPSGSMVLGAELPTSTTSKS